MKQNISGAFENLATKVTAWTGSSASFLIAFAVVLIWALSGPIFDFSETWQLVINTGTTIVTFLMVFIIKSPKTKNQRLSN